MPQLTRHNLLTIWLLSLAIIMTPWLSFWATPVLAQNQQGETVVLCTLNGLQRVVIQSADFTSGKIIAEPTAQDEQYCPALQLIKAFSQGLLLTPPLALSHHHSGTLPQARHDTVWLKTLFSAYRGRAPPLA